MKNFSRRSFVKNLAGAAAAAAVLPAAEACARGEKPMDYSADVVVVGLGGAGAATAITAADNGASVIILEKQPLATLRSNTRLSGGWVHSPDPAGDKEALKKYFAALFSGKYNDQIPVGEDPEYSEKMAQYWTEYTPKLYGWLQSLDPELKGSVHKGSAQYVNFPGARDCSFQSVHLGYPEKLSFNQATYNRPKLETVEGEALWNALKTGIENRSGKIQIIDACPALSLIRNEKGEVIGVNAEKDGAPVKVIANKAVVLACGGYEYNKAMRKAFLPGLGESGYAFYGTPYNEGDGIRMGMEIGAGLTKAPACAARMIWGVPVFHKGMRIGVTTNGVGGPNSLVVNSYGKRFCNENKIMGGITNNSYYEKAGEQNLDTMQFDNQPAWHIFDETARLARPLANLNRSTVGYGFVDYGAPDNSDAIAKGWILKADTIEALG